MSNPWAEIQRPLTDYNVKLASSTHPLNFFWGIDARGDYLLVIEFVGSASGVAVNLPDLTGIRTAKSELPDRVRVILLLVDRGNWELFEALSRDLIRVSEKSPTGVEAFNLTLRRLQKWHELLKKSRSPFLSPEEIKGLLGELLFLRDTLVPHRDLLFAVDCWKGPEGGPQDFAVLNVAVEIKSQSGSTKPSVRISSIDQLNPQLPFGYLVVFTLANAQATDPKATTLNRIVGSIRSTLEAVDSATRERFESLLFAAGYITHEYYDRFVFQTVSTQVFEIRTGFPRIERGAVPSGVQRITFDLMLDSCAPFVAELQLDR